MIRSVFICSLCTLFLCKLITRFCLTSKAQGHKTNIFYILMNDLSTVQFRIQNDPSLLLKLVVLSPFLFLAQPNFDLSPPTLLSLNSNIRVDRMQKRLLLTALTTTLQRPHSSNIVDLVTVKIMFEVTSKFVLLPDFSWTSKLSCTLQLMFHNQCLT